MAVNPPLAMKPKTNDRPNYQGSSPYPKYSSNSSSQRSSNMALCHETESFGLAPKSSNDWHAQTSTAANWPNPNNGCTG